MADDRAMRRKVALLKIRLRALRALDSRAEAGAAAAGGGVALPAALAADVRDILCHELDRDARAVLTEALGYYALPVPDERPGVNEAPPGGAYARSARQGMLADRYHSAGALYLLKNRLARRLHEGGGAESLRTGH